MSSKRQTVHSIHNKKFWSEFFYLYESLPAIWDINSPLYKNRQVKCDAYDIMVDKLREIEPNADREDVLRKINIFRTNFRRECSRINMSLREGKQYQSTLWYFDMLCFLQTVDTRRDRKRKIDDDGEKSIMRKRRTANLTRKSTDQLNITSKKENLIEYEPRSTHEFEYDLEEEPDFEYVPDDLSHELADAKNSRTSQAQHNHLAVDSYQGEEEDDEDDQSIEQDYNNQEQFHKYTLQRNIQANNNKLKLDAKDGLKFCDKINSNENPLEVNHVSDEQQVFNEYASDNETETLQAEQWCLKSTSDQNISTLQLEKTGLHVGNKATSNTIKFTDNTSTKFVRDVKTMTSNGFQASCSIKLSESSEILAKSWAVQYDELSQDQKVLARKAINDILFEGCMGHLAVGSNGHITNTGANYKHHRTITVTPNEEVESSEIYEQPTITTSSTSSTSEPVAEASTASTPKVHATDEWLKL